MHDSNPSLPTYQNLVEWRGLEFSQVNRIVVAKDTVEKTSSITDILRYT